MKAKGLFLVAVCLAVVSPSVLFAGRLKVKVLNGEGQPVVSLAVSIRNLDTGERHSATTDADGSFAINLARGDYLLHAAGTDQQDNGENQEQAVHLVLQRESGLDIELECSRDLARGLTTLRARQPAERETATRSESSEESELSSIRDYEVLLPGGMNGNATATRSLPELVNPFAASRRGRFHGSLYEFHRNDNLDARNFFDPVGEPLPEYKRNQFGFSLSASLLPHLELMGSYDGLRISQGSTLLSHVPTVAMKRGDLSELLVREEGRQLTDPFTGEELPNNRIPTERIHPVAARLLSLFPDPNRADPDRNYVNNQPLINHQDAYTVKLDYQLGKSKVSTDYRLRDNRVVRPYPLPAFGADEESRNQDISLGFSHPFTRRLQVDYRYTFVRSRTARLSHNANRPGLLESVGIAGLSVNDPSDEGYPEFDLAGYADLGDQSSPATSAFNGFFSSFAVAYSMDSHTVQTGMNFDFRQYNNYRYGGSHRGRFAFNGNYSGDAFADFLLGLPETVSRASGADRSDLRGSNWTFFLRDTWKITHRFSVSSSLSYVYSAPYRSVRDNVSGFFPLALDPSPDGELIQAGSDRARRYGLPDRIGSMVGSDKNNFAPRVGLAYNPLGSSRLVFRSSYGLGYDQSSPGVFLSYLGHNYPFYYMETVQSPIGYASIDLANPFRAGAAAELNVRGIDPNLRIPYYQDWQMSASSEFMKHWTLQGSYRGEKGTRIIRILPANVPLPGPGNLQPRRPNPAFGRFTIATNSGSYSGHSVELEAGRRFSGGFSLDSSIRWNRALSDQFSGSPNNLRDLRAERAPVGYQPNRRFSLRYILDLPFGAGRPLANELGGTWAEKIVSGWRLTGITHVQDGTPFTVVMAGDLNNDGLGSERPDRVGPGNLDPAQRSVDRWFNTEHFLQPAPYSFGNAGRNILLGPGYQNWDVSIIKQTRFSDGDLIELRIELFNAFNQVNFEDPVAVLGNTTFGKIFGAGRAREIEVALKYSF